MAESTSPTPSHGHASHKPVPTPTPTPLSGDTPGSRARAGSAPAAAPEPTGDKPKPGRDEPQADVTPAQREFKLNDEVQVVASNGEVRKGRVTGQAGPNSFVVEYVK